MNELQKQTVEELRKILPTSHFINIKVRVDGEWREYEADFLKEILANPVENRVMPKIADGEKLFDAIRDYGDAKLDVGYYSDESDLQIKAQERVEKYWDALKEIIESNFTA